MQIISEAKAGNDVTKVLRKDLSWRNAAQKGIRGDRINVIELSNVSFSYPGKTKKVLNNINLCFERGRSYCLKGKTGAGKSTLVDLMLKFRQPDSGTISINGSDIKGISDTLLRRHILLLSQKTVIFSDTVLRNISFGMDVENKDIIRAAKLARIHGEIMEMPDGYETLLSYQGENLSGGQRQRIALARALLRSPDVLIMDESTSALDKETEHEIMKDIFALYKDKILILITHNPALMESVDQIVHLGKH